MHKAWILADEARRVFVMDAFNTTIALHAKRFITERDALRWVERFRDADSDIRSWEDDICSYAAEYTPIPITITVEI